MSIYEHAKEYAGKPVYQWKPSKKLHDPANAVYRLDLDYDEEEAGQRWTDKLAALLEAPNAGELYGLAVGNWGLINGHDQTSAEVVEALVAAREQLTGLRALFIGDIISEECEISWLQQSDMAPLLAAYPALEHFRVRGNEGLSLGTFDHAQLKSLIVESGGLSLTVVSQVATAKLPALEHLELWLGTSEYGAQASVRDLQPILAGTLFPRLRYLGLRDSEIADEIAQELTDAPIMERIEVLDLSLGVLSDYGATALLECPALKRLKKLDLHHHYCTAEMVEQLRALVSEVDASEAQDRDEDADEDEEDRYVAVGE